MARMEKDNINIPDADKPEKIKGSIDPVVNSNEYILNNIGAYLEYLRAEIKQIIINDDLKYSDPKDKKKEYPDFTYTQFLYLLKRLQDVVFNVNTELLYSVYNNNNNKTYDVHKVELCYEVYDRLCTFYGFNCSLEGFYRLTGIEDTTLKYWLSSGNTDLLKKALENSKNNMIMRFENSTVPILNLAAGNYKYKLNEAKEDHTPAGIIATLPDLLALPGAENPPLINEK